MRNYIAVAILLVLAVISASTKGVEATPALVPEAEFKLQAATDDTKYTCCCCCGWCLSCSREANATFSYNPTLKDIFSGFGVKMIPESEAEKDSKYTCCCCCGWCLSCSR